MVLKDTLCRTVEKLKKEPYDYWLTQTFPLLLEEKADNKSVQIEIILLESEPEYIHLQATAFVDSYAGFRWPWDQNRPVSESFIVRKI